MVIAICSLGVVAQENKMMKMKDHVMMKNGDKMYMNGMMKKRKMEKKSSY
ncbi:hypothetical protein [Flavobacterium gawalongense]|nr:hypothetical protein [Flavobacterium gawalongense]